MIQSHTRDINIYPEFLMAKKKETKNIVSLKRTPIVAVMGHVDHGKTSLLDAIRDTEVAAGEAGGITQNTRAHQVKINDQKITFIDTPGHEAFSEMRARGAKVTDIVMLVVAADDGVQPQTKESIKFALEEKVPVIVALNKMDLPDTNLVKLKQQLSTAGLLLEEHGGDVIIVEVSAKTKKGIDELLESTLLLAEMSELKKHKVKNADGEGFVLESNLDKHLGAVSLMLIKGGEANKGDYVVYEGGYSKVRDLLDEKQVKMEKGEEGDPVWIIGLDEVLATGEVVKFVKTEKDAKLFIKKLEKGEEKMVESTEEVEEEENNLGLLAAMLNQAKIEDDINYLHLVIKASTQGTLEVVIKQLKDMEDDEVKLKILDSGTGAITEQDVKRAKAAHGLVIGFQAEIEKKVSELARKEKVLVRNYEIIYELIEEVGDVMDSLSEPVLEEIEVARAKVKKPFQLSNGTYVAGSEVIKGTVLKGYKVYILRGEERVADAKITSLKKGKNDVKEVTKGIECGIFLEPNIEVEEGDEIVCYKVEKL